MIDPEKRLPHIGTYKNLGNRKRYGIIVVRSKKGKYQDMTRLFDMAACRALHMSRPKPPKISIGIEISQPPMDGGLSSIQRSMNIGGEPHKLGYINFKEDKMLKDMGALGEPVEGTQGIPAYIGVGDEAGLSEDYGTQEGASMGGGFGDGMGHMGSTEAWTEDDIRERAAAGDEEAQKALRGERTGPGTAFAYGEAVSTPEAQEALAKGRDARYYIARQPTKYSGPIGSLLDFLFGGFPGSAGFSKGLADLLEEGYRTNYYGPRAWHEKAGIKLDYPPPSDVMEGDPTKQIGKPKRKPKEEEKEKSAMEKYLEGMDVDETDADVDERLEWWNSLPDYLKDILRNTYPEEGEGGMPKDLFTDSV